MAMDADKRCLLEKECARLRGELNKESEICHKALQTAAALERVCHLSIPAALVSLLQPGAP